MPKDYTSTTFSEVYKDDYADSDGYYRVLFNSGRPLQARELTTLQTILQTQIQRFASNIFLDGAAVKCFGSRCTESRVRSAGDCLPVVDTAARTMWDRSCRDLLGQTLLDCSFMYSMQRRQPTMVTIPTLYGVYRSANQSSINLRHSDIDPDLQ